jgi:hypothetical protein
MASEQELTVLVKFLFNLDIFFGWQMSLIECFFSSQNLTGYTREIRVIALR